MTVESFTAVVLAAGRSRRLGTPKQLLPYADSTLLGTTLDIVRRCGFAQVIVTLGGASDEVRARVPLHGVDPVVVDDAGAGCSSSLKAAIARVDPAAAGIVLMLGDQPGVTPAAIARLVERGTGDIGVCRYSDGIGHPILLRRAVFGDVARLHGDKGVWKLVEEAAAARTLTEVSIDATIPLDVDTWDDYRRLLEAAPT